METLTQALKELWRRVQYFVFRFGEDRCSQNAAALTYMNRQRVRPALNIPLGVKPWTACKYGTLSWCTDTVSNIAGPRVDSVMCAALS